MSNTLTVPGDYPSIMKALVHATTGMTIQVDPGTYSASKTGEIFPLSVPSQVKIVGKESPDKIIIDAERTAGVFSITDAEGVTLQGLTITGGNAGNGGGIYIHNSSATIVQNVITANQASVNGAGIHVEGKGTVLIQNNIFNRNSASSSDKDPHTIRIIDSAPSLINNTIVNGDGNGINISGASAATLVNNIIAYNGTDTPKARGRGICNFSTLPVTMTYNLFFANKVAAVLTPVNGQSSNLTAAQTNDLSSTDTISDNLDADPGFVDVTTNHLKLIPSSAPLSAGNPDPAYNNADGSRNTIGNSGGPRGFSL